MQPALGRENTLTRHFFTIPCPVAGRGREMRILDAVSGKVVHCHVMRRMPERNGGSLCQLRDVTLVVSLEERESPLFPVIKTRYFSVRESTFPKSD